MKTSNIRYAAILLATLMSLNLSAQKNVLKQFEKLKTAKGVTVTNSSREQGMEDESPALSWRCNVVEFKVSKVYGASLMMKELQAAFEQDSQDPDVTYFGEMKGLSERATDEERAKYKKTIVRYNAKDDPIVLGANTTYNGTRRPSCATTPRMTPSCWERTPPTMCWCCDASRVVSTIALWWRLSGRWMRRTMSSVRSTR